MSFDPANDERWEWHGDFLIGQGSANTLMRVDPEEPPSDLARRMLVEVPEMLALLREEVGRPFSESAISDSRSCAYSVFGHDGPECADREICWTHRARALLARIAGG